MSVPSKSVQAGALLSTADVCALLNVGRTTLWEMEKRKELPTAIHLNRRCKRWRLSDIEAFVASKRQ